MSGIRKVLNKGFVKLVDKLGDEQTVAQAASVSFGQEAGDPVKDRKLINFLLANGHETPFEHVVFTFHIKCPIFVARQWMRHRIGSFNEISSRYTVVQDEFYTPVYFRKQIAKNYGYENLTESECNELAAKFDNYYKWAHNFYKKLLDQGVAKEQARIILPVGQFTQFYWTVNARSLMNFIKVRADKHAQWEMQQFALVVQQFFSQTIAPTENPEEDVTNPLMFFTGKMGSYPDTILKDLNLSGMSIQVGGTRTLSDGTTEVIPSWDDTAFASDYANWKLSQTCDKKIKGNIKVTLDTICFYNIELNKRIYISGITESVLNIISKPSRN